MELTYENVALYLVESETCDEALEYLVKCKEDGKTIKEAYFAIPKIGWIMVLLRLLGGDRGVFAEWELLVHLMSFAEKTEIWIALANEEGAKDDGLHERDWGYSAMIDVRADLHEMKKDILEANWDIVKGALEHVVEML